MNNATKVRKPDSSNAGFPMRILFPDTLNEMTRYGTDPFDPKKIQEVLEYRMRNPSPRRYAATLDNGSRDVEIFFKAVPGMRDSRTALEDLDRQYRSDLNTLFHNSDEDRKEFAEEMRKKKK